MNWKLWRERPRPGECVVLFNVLLILSSFIQYLCFVKKGYSTDVVS